MRTRLWNSASQERAAEREFAAAKVVELGPRRPGVGEIAGTAKERTARSVLVHPGRLSNDHQRSVSITLAEDDVLPPLGEPAAGAGLCRCAENIQGSTHRPRRHSGVCSQLTLAAADPDAP